MIKQKQYDNISTVSLPVSRQCNQICTSEETVFSLNHPCLMHGISAAKPSFFAVCMFPARQHACLPGLIYLSCVAELHLISFKRWIKSIALMNSCGHKNHSVLHLQEQLIYPVSKEMKAIPVNVKVNVVKLQLLASVCYTLG